MRLFALFFSLPLLVIAVAPPQFRATPKPLITGDAFREYADHAYDEESMTLDVTAIKPRDTVFVRTDYLKDFFEKFHPEIPVSYILITHNADNPAPAEHAERLDDEKIIAWFGENYDGTEHPKFHQIPMGCANFNWPNGNMETLKKVQAKNVAKEHLTHMGMTIQTNYDERWPVFRLFSQQPWVYRTIKKMFEGYLTDAAASKFEIAPRGFAWDTYRLWECLYINTIPIVRSSQLDELYEDLPVLIIDDWKVINEDFLNEKYLELSQKTFNMEKTTIDYWTQKIDIIKYQGEPPPKPKPPKDEEPEAKKKKKKKKKSNWQQPLSFNEIPACPDCK